MSTNASYQYSSCHTPWQNCQEIVLPNCTISVYHSNFTGKPCWIKLCAHSSRWVNFSGTWNMYLKAYHYIVLLWLQNGGGQTSICFYKQYWIRVQRASPNCLCDYLPIGNWKSTFTYAVALHIQLVPIFNKNNKSMWSAAVTWTWLMKDDVVMVQYIMHNNGVTCSSWSLKSSVYRFFVQQLVQAIIKENIIAPHYWPRLVYFPDKGPVMRKAFPCVFMWWRHHVCLVECSRHGHWQE